MLLLLLAVAVVSAIATEPPIFLDHHSTVGTAGCVDLDTKCSVWASQGECQSNAAWMMANCRRSCKSCQGGNRAWQLRSFIAGNYDNSSAATNFSINSVTVESLRVDHVEVDETSQMMHIHGKLVFAWNDTRVRWDMNKWGVSWLNFYWLQIWTPTVVQTNAPNAKPAEISGTVLAANYTGEVFMWSDISMTAPCQFDYSRYPTDSQSCCVKLDDKRYFAVRFAVNERAEITANRLSKESHLVGWEIERISLTENRYMVKILTDWARDPFSVETTNLDMCLRVRRNAPYYSAEITGPAVACAVVTLSSFVVGSFWNQIVLLLSSLGLQVLSMVIVNSRLPPMVGAAPSVVNFYGFNLTLTLALLVVAVALWNVATARTRVPPPHAVDQALALFDRFVPASTAADDDAAALSDATGSTKPVAHWAPAARAVKLVVFAFYLILYLAVMFATFCL